MAAIESTTSNSYTRWRQLDARHHMHPFTDHATMRAEGTRVITRADGIYLWDAAGRRYLDAMAGLWCVNIGYGRKELADVAAAQMRELPYYNSFFKTAHPPQIELAAKLAELTPEGFDEVFFCGSGSEANDTVIRLVRRYWQMQGEPQRDVIIARENAYHGSTIGAASLGGMKPMHEQAGMPIPGIEHVMQPYWYALGGEHTPEDFGRAAANALEERIQAVGPERIAAFIAEPVQGAGGVIVPPATYWPEVSRICKHYGVLLVADEVICGFGRTGEWFGSTYFGLEPDLMPVAKGLSSGYLPIGAVLVHDRVATAFASGGGEFTHGYTYSGHPAACAVAQANLEIIEREGIVDHVRDVAAPHFDKRLRSLSDHPLVGEVRTVGLLGAIQLAADKSTRRLFDPAGKVGGLCRDLCLENGRDTGLVMRAVGDSMILSPPLVITPTEIDLAVELAREALDATYARLGEIEELDMA